MESVENGYLSTAQFEKIKWFKEGFTEYYAQKLTLAGGERSTEQVVASTNRDLLAFLLQRVSTCEGVIALWLDAAIRKQSNGQHSLDDVMFRLVKDRQQPLTEKRIYDTVQLYLSAAQFSSLKNAADRGGDLPAPDTIPGLGNCYHAIHGDFPPLIWHSTSVRREQQEQFLKLTRAGRLTRLDCEMGSRLWLGTSIVAIPNGKQQ